MIKKTKLHARLDRREVENERLATISLSPSDIDPLALSLCMLVRGLVDQVSLELNGGSIELEQARKKKSSRALVRWSERSLRLMLSPQELDSLLAFVLRASRDSMAEVDHIDIEAAGETATEKQGLIMLKFPVAREPVSPEEARKRLG